MDDKVHTYSYLDFAIATGEWHNAALTELDNIINDIENGRKRFNRYHNSLLRWQPDGLRKAVAQMKRQPLSSQDLKAQVIRNRQIRARNEKNRQYADFNADSAKDKNKNG